MHICSNVHHVNITFILENTVHGEISFEVTNIIICVNIGKECSALFSLHGLTKRTAQGLSQCTLRIQINFTPVILGVWRAYASYAFCYTVHALSLLRLPLTCYSTCSTGIYATFCRVTQYGFVLSHMTA